MDPKIVSSLRKDFGAFAFLNLLNIFSFINEGVTTAEKYTSIIHIVLGLVCIYFIFVIGSLFPKNPGFLKGFVWFTLAFVIIKAFVAPINVFWAAAFLIAIVYLQIKLNKASKSLMAPSTPLPIQ